MADTISTKHTVAARLTADASQFTEAFKASMRGIDSFKTSTGQAFTEVTKKVDAFDAVIKRAARDADQAALAAKHAAREMVNFSGPVAPVGMPAIPLGSRGMRSILRGYTTGTSQLSSEFMVSARASAPVAVRQARSADAFDDIVARSRNKEHAAALVNAHSGPLNVARRDAQQMSFMERANAGYQASGAGSMVGLGLGMAGAAGVYQALAASRNTSRTITDLMIQGDKDRSWAKNAEKEILRVSDATGKARDEVASYAQMYARLTGNVDIAMKTLGSMGKVAVATGADFGDLAQVTETVVGSLKVKDSDTYQAHDILAQQSKMGKIEYKAIASRIGQLGAEAFRFGKAGEGLPAVQALGGLFQIAARGRSVEQYGEVATGSGRFLERLSQNPEQLQKLLGVKLGVRRGGKFQWNALTDVMQAIGQGTLGKMGDEKTMKKLKTIFDDEGIRPVLQLAMAAKQGWNTKDVASGRESAAAIFGAKGGVLAEDYKKRMDDPAAKWDQAMNRMSNTLHRTMLPVLEKLSSVMPDIAKVVQFLLENSKMLAYFWLGSKGASVIRAMMGGGAGGAGGPGGYAAAAGLAGVAGVAAGVARPGVMPGSDLAVLQQQQALRMARYQQAMGGMLQALPLIPGAIEGGKWLGGKLNRWMGGTYRSEADVQRDRDLGTEQYRMNLERQSERRTRWMRVALARAGMRDWKENTVEGAKTKIERDKLVKELGLKDDDKGGFNLPLGDVMAKHGPKGLEALSSRVQDVYGRIYSKTSEQAVKEGKFEPGSEGFEKRLLEIAPELKVLGPVLKQLEATMAKVVRGEIVVHATVNIPDPSGPGARAKARTGLAATAAGQYSADYGEMEEYGGTPQHVPGML